MKFKWRLAPKRIEVSDALLAAAGGRPMLARLLALRGMTDPEEARRFLDPAAYEPAAPDSLTDLEKGVDRIEKAISRQETILVWGDFDVDGQTSTALLVSGLQGLGANVRYHIPIRETESHGIQPAFLQQEIDRGFDVLLSCDTGVAAHDAVNLANRVGIDVVITDHHDLPEVLPDAYALINPKRESPEHPLSGLPGVGVAYLLVEALYRNAGRHEACHELLDLVAMGIVADIAVQVRDTRYLLQRGLDVLRSTSRAGIRALCELARTEPASINDETIGFQLGPRLNAVGRLADANVSVELLTTNDTSKAAAIASDLEALNLRRRFETETVYESARAQLDREPSLLQYAVLVLAHPEWHQGVIGIVASRLVEEFGKPAILLSSPAGQAARGSARSVEGYHITEAIASQAEILLGFGGHPMAAGLAIDSVHIEAFRRGVSKAIIEQRTGAPPEPVLEISAEVTLDELGPSLADEIEALAPFGAGNPPVNLLCKGVQVENVELIGRDKSHRKLYVRSGSEERVEILWWNSIQTYLPEGPLDLVVRIRKGMYLGQPSTTITLQDLEPARTPGTPGMPPSFEIRDYRRIQRPLLQLKALLSGAADVQVWSEGVADEVVARNRMQLVQGSELAVWTLPPSSRVLAELIERVQPRRVHVFARDPGLDQPAPFVKRLAGLVKYTLSQYKGETTIKKLASACAHDERTIRAGLNVLPALGVKARLVDDQVYFMRCEPEPAGLEGSDLEALLREAKAFRRTLAQAASLASIF